MHKCLNILIFKFFSVKKYRKKYREFARVFVSFPVGAVFCVALKKGTVWLVSGMKTGFVK